MIPLDKYIYDILGAHLKEIPIHQDELGDMPFYIEQMYSLSYGQLSGHSFVLVTLLQDEEFNSQQLQKNLQFISKVFQKKVVLVLDKISSIMRSKLISKKIDFIAVGKQMYLPSLMMDLRESFFEPGGRKASEKLLPSAQFLFLYHLLHVNDKIQLTALSFKEIAAKLGYTQMAVSLAAENLRKHELCRIRGTKEKYIDFEDERPVLWRRATPYLVNPVLKQVYVDTRPRILLLDSNTSALPEYTDMSPSRQQYYAIEKNVYYNLRKSGGLIGENKLEGDYCLEVWKYNPALLAEDVNEEHSVDPLSLYLSLKDNPDERIEMALDQIIDRYIW